MNEMTEPNRKTWPLPSDEELKSQIEMYYGQSLDERLERYKFIWQEFGPPVDMLLVGGMSAALAIEELKLCYVEGFYMACVLLCQTFIENSLGGIYIVAGEEKAAEKGFARLIDRALDDNLIDEALADRLHQLRKMRNPYIHPKAGAEGRTIVGRMIEKAKEGIVFDSLYEFAKEDAIQSIRTTVDFLRSSSRKSGDPWDP